MPADPISRALQAIHDDVERLDDGAVADYIPTLAAADPDRFGLAVASLGGRVYSAGDADDAFTIQSASKPFVHALALAALGLEEVLRHVGAEPTGEAFNAVSLEPGTGRPFNPMINAGAIVTTSLLATDAAPGFEGVLAGLSAFAGRRLDVDEATFESERETGDRNRALAYLMKAAGSLRGPVEAIVDAYFRQCSVLVTATDLAVMAATLANGGVNVKTGERVVGPSEAAQAVTVMATCGMYDYSGEWLLRARLPAKSGVSGALLAVSPGQFGIGLFSPRVDAGGHSVRAVAAVQRITEQFELDLTRHPGLTSPPVRERREHNGVAVWTLQGELDFAAAEIVLRELDFVGVDGAVVLDLSAVTAVWPVSDRLLAAAIANLIGAGTRVAVVGRDVPGSAAPGFATVPDAAAWCRAAGLQPRGRRG